MKRRPQPLPNESRSRRLQARIAQHLPYLRQTPPPPCRYDHVTLLLYYFPQTVEAHTFDAFEFALRQTCRSWGGCERLSLPTTLP